MKANGVGTLIQWNGQPIHGLKKLGYTDDQLPYTDQMFKKCLMLPMNTSLSNEDVDYVCEKVKEFYIG